jgi:ABC-2 type transport system ATP-binding protein
MCVSTIVEFEGVCKSYAHGLLSRRRLPAVRDVTWSLELGEIVGLIGPNRAGKTTLVKILLSLSRLDAGTARRFGRPLDDRSTLSRVGYIHENQAFPRYLSATEILHYYGAMSLLPEPTVRARSSKLLERVGLADRAHESITRFSKGMVQRLALAQALLNEPDLLVFDEPTEGLDLDGRQIFRDVILEQRGRGGSVLLITHLLSEVEALCDRVAILSAGRLAYAGAIPALLLDGRTGAPRTLEQAVQSFAQAN